MSPGDLVIYAPEPLLFSGELLVLSVETGGDGRVRLLCEQVNYEPEHEDDAPPRGLFLPHDRETASRWARTA